MCTQVRLQRSWILIQMVSNHKKKKNSKTIFDHVSHGTRLLPSYSFYPWANEKKRLDIVVFVIRYFAKRNISTCEYALKEGSATYFLPLFESLGDKFSSIKANHNIGQLLFS